MNVSSCLAIFLVAGGLLIGTVYPDRPVQVIDGGLVVPAAICRQSIHALLDNFNSLDLRPSFYALPGQGFIELIPAWECTRDAITGFMRILKAVNPSDADELNSLRLRLKRLLATDTPSLTGLLDVLAQEDLHPASRMFTVDVIVREWGDVGREVVSRYKDHPHPYVRKCVAYILDCWLKADA